MGLEPGRVVGGRHLIESEIASGGMGTVYRAHDQQDDRPVALKVVRRDLVPGRKMLERFRREARVLSRIDHTSVVRMLDAGLTDDGCVFLTMELVEGETLLEYLKRESPVIAGAFTPIVTGIAAALDAVHAHGVVHRDLKPSNVFVTDGGVKLVDFGVAFAAEYTRLTLTGQLVGTIRYMAPEQLLGRPFDHRADTYALGVIVWGAVVGGPPFVGRGMAAAEQVLRGVPPLDIVVPGVGPELVHVVQRAVAREPASRYPSAGAFAEAFARAAPHAPMTRPHAPTGFSPIEVAATTAQASPRAAVRPAGPARTSGSPVKASRPPRRGVVALWVAGIALLAVAGIAALMVSADPEEANASTTATDTAPSTLAPSVTRDPDAGAGPTDVGPEPTAPVPTEHDRTDGGAGVSPTPSRRRRRPAMRPTMAAPDPFAPSGPSGGLEIPDIFRE